MKLTPQQRQAILDQIDDLFSATKARLLGRFFKGKRIYFEIVKRADPFQTIEGIFRYTLSLLYGPGSDVDNDLLESLSDITGNYIDSKKMQIQNQILNGIAKAKTPKEAMSIVKQNIKKASDYMDMLIVSQAREVQANAENVGIAKVAATLGIDDPIVCKRGVIDEKMCKNCRLLWHSEDNIYVPKVYKLSELRDGYMTDQKNPYPTKGFTHPNCRHVLSFIPPNMGFDEKGVIKFIGFGHDEYQHQRKK